MANGPTILVRLIYAFSQSFHDAIIPHNLRKFDKNLQGHKLFKRTVFYQNIMNLSSKPASPNPLADAIAFCFAVVIILLSSILIAIGIMIRTPASFLLGTFPSGENKKGELTLTRPRWLTAYFGKIFCPIHLFGIVMAILFFTDIGHIVAYYVVVIATFWILADLVISSL